MALPQSQLGSHNSAERPSTPGALPNPDDKDKVPLIVGAISGFVLGAILILGAIGGVFPGLIVALIVGDIINNGFRYE